jgi:hypothetical protein
MATISELSDPDRRREFLEAFEEGDFLGLFPERCELLEGLDDDFGALASGPIFFILPP